MKIKRFEDIAVWKKARSLVKLIYEISSTDKLSKDYEMKNQIRSAGISVMSNIAEGFGRRSNLDFSRFLDIAHGSCEEVKSLLYISLDLNYLTQVKFDEF